MEFKYIAAPFGLFLQAALLTGCGFDVPPPPSNMLEQTMNLSIAKPQNNIDPTRMNKSNFDATISVSMRKRVSPIRISTQNRIDLVSDNDFIVNWMDAVSQSGGNILKCPERGSVGFELTNAIKWIYVAGEYALEEHVFGPAEKYNIIGYVDAIDNDIIELEFRSKDTAVSCN